MYDNLAIGWLWVGTFVFFLNNSISIFLATFLMGYFKFSTGNKLKAIMLDDIADDIVQIKRYVLLRKRRAVIHFVLVPLILLSIIATFCVLWYLYATSAI